MARTRYTRKLSILILILLLIVIAGGIKIMMTNKIKRSGALTSEARKATLLPVKDDCQ